MLCPAAQCPKLVAFHNSCDCLLIISNRKKILGPTDSSCWIYKTHCYVIDSGHPCSMNLSSIQSDSPNTSCSDGAQTGRKAEPGPSSIPPAQVAASLSLLCLHWPASPSHFRCSLDRLFHVPISENTLCPSHSLSLAKICLLFTINLYITSS